MSEVPMHAETAQQSAETGSFDVRSAARAFALLHLAGGLLTLFGPVTNNDSESLVNSEPGLFLGLVAVNRRHSMVHLLLGTVGLVASRDATSARRYMCVGTLLFGTLAAVGWRRFGFESGIHMIAGIAVDRWGNIGHTLLSGMGLFAVLKSLMQS